MKKEKSLLLAVGTSIAALAMAFTISSCSGDNGKDGAEGKPGEAGTACTISGNKITCGDKDITVSNGLKGDDGSKCSIDANLKITCDDGTEGQLNTCTAKADSKNSFLITITCGSQVSISMCKGETFDTDTDYCKSDGDIDVLSTCAVTATTNEKYNPDTHYCKWTALLGATKAVTANCGDKTGTSNPNGSSYSATAYCQYTSPTTAQVGETSAATTCSNVGACCEVGASGTKTAFNVDKWEGEYCGSDGTNGKVLVHCDFIDENTASSVTITAEDAQFCGYETKADAETGKSARKAIAFCADDEGTEFNADSWEAKYCGYDDGGEIVVTDGACDDGDGPNTDAYEQGYCQYDEEGATAYTAEYCDEANGYKTVSSKPTATQKTMNATSYAGQYCMGYEEAYDDGAKFKVSNSYCLEGSDSKYSICTSGASCFEDGNKLNDGDLTGIYGQVCDADGGLTTCNGGTGTEYADGDDLTTCADDS